MKNESIPRKFRKGLYGIASNINKQQKLDGKVTKDYLDLTLEVFDDRGNLVEQVSVEMVGNKIPGQLIRNGDKVFVCGRKNRHGFIEAKSIYIVDTKLTIEPESSNSGCGCFLGIIGIVAIILFIAVASSGCTPNMEVLNRENAKELTLE